MNVIRSTKQRARKEHRCIMCCDVAVRRGEEYHKDIVIHDGTLHTVVWCADCRAAVPLVRAWFGEPDEGVGEDDFSEWAREAMEHPDHRDAARAYLERRERARAHFQALREEKLAGNPDA